MGLISNLIHLIPLVLDPCISLSLLSASLVYFLYECSVQVSDLPSFHAHLQFYMSFLHTGCSRWSKLLTSLFTTFRYYLWLSKNSFLNSCMICMYISYEFFSAFVAVHLEIDECTKKVRKNRANQVCIRMVIDFLTTIVTQLLCKNTMKITYIKNICSVIKNLPLWKVCKIYPEDIKQKYRPRIT